MEQLLISVGTLLLGGIGWVAYRKPRQYAEIFKVAMWIWIPTTMGYVAFVAGAQYGQSHQPSFFPDLWFFLGVLIGAIFFRLIGPLFVDDGTTKTKNPGDKHRLD